MIKKTYQIKNWAGRFGKEYTDRNALSLSELDKLYRKNCGVSRREMNNAVIGRLNRNLRILEVGSNIGNQLLLLKKMGFKNLYGIEINSYAIEFSKSRTKDINIIKGSAFDIPFKDKYFDLVFTSGVLIHIHPLDIKKVMEEIHRSTRRYIWGFEYYAPKFTEIIYRGKKNMHWKADYAKLYMDLFDDLKLVREKRYKYIDNDNIDVMFLLRKKN